MEAMKAVEQVWLETMLQFILNVLYTAVVIAAVAIVYLFIKRLFTYYKIRQNLRLNWSGPASHWFWGHLGMVTKGNKDPGRFITWFTQKEKEYPVGFTLYAGPFSAILMLYHPGIVKEILSMTAFEAPKGRGGYKSLIPWLGKGLLVLNDWQWYRHRKLLTSAFHFDILKPYIQIMDSCSQTLVRKWSSLTSDGKTGHVEIFNESSLLTLDTILRCLMGFESHCQDRRTNSYIDSIYELSKLLVKRRRGRNILATVVSSYYNSTDDGKAFKRACDIVHRFTDKLIRERKAEIPKKEKPFFDFLDILIQARDSEGIGLSDSDIRAEVDTFLFEGHDTTASALSWTLYCLSINPEHQDLCVEEIKSALGDNKGVRWRDMSSLPHLTRCIKESLRMFPPVPVILRKLNKDVTFEGSTILKGTTVQLSIIGVQRNEQFWKNPKKFDPSRFDSENVAQQHHHAFIPFSAGPRNCIGQHFAMNELRVVLANVLRKFSFSLDESKEIVPCHEVILRARGGIHLKIRERT